MSECGPNCQRPGCRKITVCDACFRACCWQGDYMCDLAIGAGTVEKTLAELKALALENPRWWGDQK